MRKLVAFILSFATLVTGVFCFAPVTFASVDGADIPVVHVVGTGEEIFRKDENGNIEQLFPLQIPDGYIEEKAEIFLPVFAEAFFTQQWDEFSDVLYECVIPILSKPALDKNGEVSDGSYISWSWSRETLADKKNNGKYGVTEYIFEYDWRLSPLTIADTLHEYIEDVMYVTGAEEVALYGRCLGSNIVAAYMQKYDGEHVSEVIHYASALYGATQCSKLFTGELYLHPDGINRYIYDVELELDLYITEFIQAFVTLLNKTYGLDVVSWAVENVLEDIYLDIFPRILIESYATYPGYWSMVSVDDFDKAMETVFYGSDREEYKGLIEKIETYRNTVQLVFEDTVKAQEEKGIEFSNIVKYGMQSIPITKNSDDLSDGLVTVYESGFGATATLTDKTFSNEYMIRAIENQTARYISPDLQIDASTCLSPDTTWFIKNLFHKDFPSCVNGLVSDIVNNEGFTVDSSDEYPQYLVYDEENNTISPMTSTNMNTTERWTVTFFEALLKFLKNLFQIVKNLLVA